MRALINNRFYAHLSRTLGLVPRLIIAQSTNDSPRQSERVLGGLFEAYIGGMHRELGLAGYQDLYTWFRELMEPYAIDCFRQMQGAAFLASSLCYIADNNIEASQQLARGATDETAEVSSFSSYLNHYANKYRLPAPTYSFEMKGAPHAPVWLCTVQLGDRAYAGPPRSVKAWAKDGACEAAIAAMGLDEYGVLDSQNR